MKDTDPICPIFSAPINPFLQIFMSDVGSSDYGNNEGCHGHNVI